MGKASVRPGDRVKFPVGNGLGSGRLKEIVPGARKKGTVAIIETLAGKEIRRDLGRVTRA